MQDGLKSALMSGAKASGAFSLASRLSADRLRILCYHGIAFENEHRLSPGTFMRPETFRQRMQWLHDWGATVLPFDSALEQLQKGSLPPRSVVITIDDGWFGTYSCMAPILREFDFPATIYLSTYYIEKQTFVFNLFVQYLLMLAGTGSIELRELHDGLDGRIDLGDPGQKQLAAQQIIDFGESHCDVAGREALCEQLASLCSYDIDAARARRILKFINRDEVAELAGMGFDLQLHTHAHVFSPTDKQAATEQIRKNVSSLTDMGVGQTRHFCYPSGEYVAEHADWLEELEVDTAVTTEFGLASADMPRHFLPRICDSDAMAATDFEGAVTGFKDMLRRLSGRGR